MTETLFHLDRAAREARRGLARACERDLNSWTTVVRGWKRHKAALIAALDPATGRRAIEYRQTQKETSTIERLDRICSAILRAAEQYPCLSHVAHLLNAGSLDTIAHDSLLLSLGSFRRGQRIGRGIAAYLRANGNSADGAAQIVDRITTEAQIRPRIGWIVLSANILDLLTCSENCAYTSCHSFTGCHRAGPQQYLQDRHTVVVYYHEDEEPCESEGPRKLFRQMVYVDAARGAAALQRHYGQSLPESCHKTIRREIAGLLARLRNPDSSEEPHWHHGHETRNAGIDDGAQLAFLDSTVDYVALTPHARPIIYLASSVPCPECGNELDKPGLLVCEDCANDGELCNDCGCRVSDDDVYHVDGEAYCESCYSQTYFHCDRCGEDFVHEDSCGDDSNLCHSCWEHMYVACERCGNDVPCDDYHTIDRTDGDSDGPYCESCYDRLTVACDDCDETIHIDDAQEGSCPECYSAWLQRHTDLLARLYRSPAFMRAGEAYRIVLIDRWQRASKINVSADYLPTIINALENTLCAS